MFYVVCVFDLCNLFQLLAVFIYLAIQFIFVLDVLIDEPLKCGNWVRLLFDCGNHRHPGWFLCLIR